MRALPLGGVVVVALLAAASHASADLPLASAPETPTLFRASAAVPFVKEAIAARIDHRYAITEHRQLVRNATAGQAEGQFDLSTVDSAVVTRFSYWNGDQEIKGELLERADAKQMYDAVTRAQRDPGLLEETAPGRFHFRIFPFAPSEAKRVELRWETTLPARGRAVEYRTPIARPSTVVVVDVEGATPGSISSDTHEIQIEALSSPRLGVRVRSGAARGAPAQFTLRYELSSPAAASFVHQAPNGDAFVALDFPAAEATSPAPPRDVTFLVDRSGSESLEALARTREAVRDAIKRVSRKDRVNVIAFDETTTALFPEPRDASEENIREASAFVAKIRDGAGTDLAAALRRAFETQSTGTGRDRLVFLVTDGGSDKSAAVAAAEKGPADVRVVAFGVGDTVDAELLGRVTAPHGGFVEIATPGEDLAPRLVRVFDRTTHPQLQHAKIELSGGAELAAPLSKTIASGDRVLAYVRTHARGGILRARLSGDFGTPDTRVVSAIDVDLSKAQERPWVAKAWAKAKMDAAYASGDQEAAVELALANDLTSRHTAFFAIPASEAARVKGQLDAARQRKRWLSAENEIAPPIAEVYATGVAPQSATPTTTLAAPPPPAPPRNAPSAESSGSDSVHLAVERSPHGRGCAGCALVDTTHATARDRAAALLLAGLGLGAVLARRRRRERDDDGSEQSRADRDDANEGGAS